MKETGNTIQSGMEGLHLNEITCGKDNSAVAGETEGFSKRGFGHHRRMGHGCHMKRRRHMLMKSMMQANSPNCWNQAGAMQSGPQMYPAVWGRMKGGRHFNHWAGSHPMHGHPNRMCNGGHGNGGWSQFSGGHDMPNPWLSGGHHMPNPWLSGGHHMPNPWMMSMFGAPPFMWRQMAHGQKWKQQQKQKEKHETKDNTDNNPSAELDDQISDDKPSVNEGPSGRKNFNWKKRQLMQAMALNELMYPGAVMSQEVHSPNFMWPAVSFAYPGRWRKMQHQMKKNKHDLGDVKDSSSDEETMNMDESAPEQEPTKTCENDAPESKDKKECRKCCKGWRHRRQMWKELASEENMHSGGMGFGPFMPPPPPHVQAFMRKQMWKAMKNELEKKDNETSDNIDSDDHSDESHPIGSEDTDEKHHHHHGHRHHGHHMRRAMAMNAHMYPNGPFMPPPHVVQKWMQQKMRREKNKKDKSDVVPENDKDIADDNKIINEDEQL